MKKLNTIQKREKLNEVYTEGERGNGGAYHTYDIKWKYKGEYSGTQSISFQSGARHSMCSVNGVLDSDLLEIVRHRLQCFQGGEYATRENQMALNHIEEALMWLNRRVEDRIERDVLGTMSK